MRFAPAAAVTLASAMAAVGACGLGVRGSVEPDAGALLATDAADGDEGAAGPSDGGLDAAPDAPPATCEDACPDAGGTCDDGGVCNFACGALPSAACLAGPVCPAGLPCHVTCTLGGSCPNVQCSGDCTVDCNAPSTCGPVACSADHCNVNCRSGDSCSGPITTSSNESVIACSASNSCREPISCSGSDCIVTCANGSSCSTITCCAATCKNAAVRSQACP